jgi:beta-glucosidase
MKNIESIISEMTLEEKAALCTGATAWTTTPIERLGVPELFVADGPHGVRRVVDISELNQQSLPATCFPTASCLASTWNTDLIYRMGVALAEECIAQEVDVLLGPGVNMKRSPLCGRNFEYFSEDPFLAGELAASLINGVQSKGVGTSLKHFAANNQEFQRLTISAEIDERTLREIYLTAFEKVVKQAKPWTVMCAYNKINGEYCSENHTLLTDILKDEWGFEGFVVSDWGAVHDRVAALKGGLDLEMPGPQERRVQAVIEAVQSGELDESLLDEAVRRILKTVAKAQETPKGAPFDVEAHHALAHQVANEGVVLLKNNGLLPLKAPQHIAVIGHAAQKAHFQGEGSSHVNATRVDVPFVALQTGAKDAEFSYAEGYPVNDAFRQDLIDQAVEIAKTADVAVLYIALPNYIESEGYDRTSLDLTPQQISLIKAVSAVQPNSVVVLNNGAPVVMQEWIDGVAAVLEGWMMGQAGGVAISDVLFGKVNPSGKLAETFPLKLADTPATLNWPGGAGKVYYGEGLYIGYRYYDAKQMPVQFPFGYGLSYTTFEYSNPKVSTKTFKDVDGLTISLDITNTGDLPGAEIVQVYVHDHESELARPEKELKGFAKIALQPGETKTVSIPLDFRTFAYYHPRHRQWITESGEFDILIGASSTDIRHIETVTLESTLVLKSLLDRESTVGEWLDDPRGKIVLQPLMTKLLEESRHLFGNGDEDQETTDRNILLMVSSMPLLSILMFQQEMLDGTAEQTVDALLSQVHDGEA